MKKYGVVLTIAALIIALGTGYILYQKKQEVEVLARKRLGQKTILAGEEQVIKSLKRDLTLEPQFINVLKGKVKGDVASAKQQVVEKTLRELHHKNWLEDEDLKADYLFANIYKDNREEFILALSRGKDLGMLFVFAELEEGYKLVTRLRGLVPINQLGVVGIPGFPYKGLVLEEYLDEMTGGFFVISTRSIYLFTEERLNKAWERVKYLKEYYPQGGRLKGKETQWWMNIEEVDIRFPDKGKIAVAGTKTETRFKTVGEMAGDYEVVHTREITENYVWDAKELKFKLLD